MNLTPEQKASAKPLPPFIRPLRDKLRAGKKTQTRRVIKDPAIYGCLTGDCPHDQQSECDAAMAALAKYQPGDICYLREPLANVNGWAFYQDSDDPVSTPTGVLAWRWQVKTLSQLFLPAEFARTYLRIEAVRAPRVQDITEADALAEGVHQFGPHAYAGIAGMRPVCGDARTAFHTLWDSINDQRGFAWAANPFVWAYTFNLIGAQKPKT